MLQETEWMDLKTKKYALEKVKINDRLIIENQDFDYTIPLNSS